jgi:hypothetical protein
MLGCTEHNYVRARRTKDLGTLMEERTREGVREHGVWGNAGCF